MEVGLLLRHVFPLGLERAFQLGCCVQATHHRCVYFEVKREAVDQAAACAGEGEGKQWSGRSRGRTERQIEGSIIVGLSDNSWEVIIPMLRWGGSSAPPFIE